MSRVTLSIPGTPPSYNVTAHAHWWKVRCHKQQWQQFCGIALMEQAVPRGLEVVSASAELHFKQRRRRDEDNFKVVISKALGDALVEGGWLDDDTADRFSFGAVQLVAPSPEPLTLVHLDHR